MIHLVLDIGNFRIKGAFFEEDHLLKDFVLAANPFPEAPLRHILQEKKFQDCLIASVNAPVEKLTSALLEKEKLPFRMLKISELRVHLNVDEPDQVGLDRIANVYGALFHFPQNDCIVVDIGTVVTFDLVQKNGSYLGGAIYPGPNIGAKALANYTDKLPLVTFDKPPSALGKTTQTHIQSGLYFGLLGAIERIVSELSLTANSPSSVKIIATGGATRMDETNPNPSKIEFVDDLKELVDFINPQLTLIGLHEMFKEIKNKGGTL